MLALSSDVLRSPMQMIHRELVNPVDRSDEALAALALLVAIELQRTARRELPAHAIDGRGPSRLAAWQLRRIRERVAGEGRQPAVDELAVLCGLSTRHLQRQFKALTGLTVAEYLETAWLERAKGLLAEGCRPVKAVAQACGFAHANSFARAFLRATGLSPQAYRRHQLHAKD